MVGKSLMQSAALAVLAAVGAMAVPVQAQDADHQERQEMRAQAREERQQQRVEHQVAAPREEHVERQAAPVQATAGERYPNRGDNEGNRGGDRADAWQQQRDTAGQTRAAPEGQTRTAPEGGWRSQRAPDGQRDGRNWDNGGAVNRPAPADDAATPIVPQRGSVEQWRGRGEAHSDVDRANRRNRTYSDPNRSGTYQGDRNRSAETWRNQQGDRNGTYRNGYHDGRNADTYRDRRDWDQSYRNGYASSSRDHRQWDRNDWRRDNRYNWSGYRNQHRSLFSAGRYYSPYNNYSYSRLSIGFFLNSGFYGQNYWINDPYQYRLPEIYGPYRWVRYYDDVLLVDIYSGEVVDVIHDFFW